MIVIAICMLPVARLQLVKKKGNKTTLLQIHMRLIISSLIALLIVQVDEIKKEIDEIVDPILDKVAKK